MNNNKNVSQGENQNVESQNNGSNSIEESGTCTIYRSKTTEKTEKNNSNFVVDEEKEKTEKVSGIRGKSDFVFKTSVILLLLSLLCLAVFIFLR